MSVSQNLKKVDNYLGEKVHNKSTDQGARFLSYAGSSTIHAAKELAYTTAALVESVASGAKTLVDGYVAVSDSYKVTTGVAGAACLVGAVAFPIPAAACAAAAVLGFGGSHTLEAVKHAGSFLWNIFKAVPIGSLGALEMVAGLTCSVAEIGYDAAKAIGYGLQAAGEKAVELGNIIKDLADTAQTISLLLDYGKEHEPTDDPLAGTQLDDHTIDLSGEFPLV